MKNLTSLLNNYSTTDIRTALYYLGRHLKQAPITTDYTKDIFDDGSKISPSEEVKNLTLDLLNFIETTSQKCASAFDDSEFNLWITKINEIDSSLDPDITEDKKISILKEVYNFTVKK
ncbi:hypothetical protein ACUTSW_14425 [Serratia sp. TSA_198.1]|uniref:hypothetical protein n=1 Tax=Serratia sp. TSA_198.1 TaxID=3415664 RepID=UPI0040454EA7